MKLEQEVRRRRRLDLTERTSKSTKKERGLSLVPTLGRVDFAALTKRSPAVETLAGATFFSLFFLTFKDLFIPSVQML